jgi:orotidine-5'-phosphate decarboxylase
MSKGSSKISMERSIIVACDVISLKSLDDLVSSTCDIAKIGGYKVGFALGLEHSLKRVVRTIKDRTDKPIMYDHQKGGTDVPHTGALFADVMAEAGIDYAILFPFSSPSAESAWIDALLKRSVTPIVGAMMTIPDFLNSKGGFWDPSTIGRIIEIACSKGVTDFVLPGNKPDQARMLRSTIESAVPKPSYYLPGIGIQGGEISSVSEVMGQRWHAIVGRAIYGAQDIHGSAASLAKEVP